MSFYQAVEEPDGLGGVSETASLFACVWAAVRPMTGREFLLANQVQGDISVEVTIRYLEGLTPSMWVETGGHRYSIVSIADKDLRRRELVLLCREIPAEAT